MKLTYKSNAGFAVKPMATAIAVASALLVAGCSSGGGGPSDSERLPHAPDDATYDNPYDQDVDIEGKVTVGVVDTGFRETHEVFEGKIAFKTNSVDGSQKIGGEEDHGTMVGSVIGLNNSNAVLMLAKANEAGAGDSADPMVIFHGVKTLASNGARVINASYSGLFNTAPEFTQEQFDANDGLYETVSHRDVLGRDALQEIVTSNDGKGSVYTVAAGNSGEALSTPAGLEAIYDSLPDVNERMLIVGAINQDGDLEAYSNFPGDDPGFISRFLVAPGTSVVANSDGDETYFYAQGTSFAAPMVASYAASIIHTWPHLSADVVSGLLLDTADRSHEYYDQFDIRETIRVQSTDENGDLEYDGNGDPVMEDEEIVVDECGGGELTCGEFYMGQGVADLESALNPYGDLVMPTGAHVDDGGVAATASHMTLSGAFGQVNTSALKDVMILDELGRDYRFDMSSGIQQKDGFNRSQIDRMTRTSNVGQGGVATSSFSGNNFNFVQNFRGNGDILASRFDAKLPAMTLTGFHFQGSEMNPMDIRSESGFMPMMSWQGGHAMTQNLGDTRGVAMERAVFHPNLAVGVSHWSGKSTAETSDYSAQRSDMTMGWSVTPDLSVELGTSISSEEKGLMGATGAGELSFGDSNDLQTYRTTVAYQLSPALSGFATYEMGRGDIDGSGMIKGINNLRTSEMSLGIQWKADKHHLGFSFSQPAYIESGVMSLDVPVGRDVEGNILRESREMSLSSNGRQRDFEMGYARAMSDLASWRINLMHTLEPGHNADVSSDTSAVLSFQRQF